VAPGVVETAMQSEIRATPEHAFPERERFVALHDEGELRRPEDVARELWRLLDSDLPNGSVLDLRALAESGRPAGAPA
jgi:benzil reductase ((S)-benzoin forming)